MASEDVHFQFAPIHSLVLVSGGSKTEATIELFEKWGFGENIKFASFSYDKHFQSYLKESFTLDFFHSVDALKTISSKGVLVPLLAAKDIDSVTVEHIPSTVLNMEFFDKLWKCGVIKNSGRIAKCFDEVFEDFVISDELRKMLLVEDSDNYEVFSKAERKEFIFRLFKHLQLGGRVNQYEDDIKPYLDTCKLLYKEIVTVVKDMNTKTLSVASMIYKVQAKVKDEVIFPGRGPPHEQSFCYLILNNIKRLVTVFYHTWN